MNGGELRFSERASELRRSFDRSFAEAPRAEVADLEDLLAIRAGPDAYAVRLAELSGLFRERKITRFPNRVPELLGIAGFRGAILPVYDLCALLGSSVAASPRWLLIAAGTPVALAFDAFEGHLRLSRAAIAQEGRAQGSPEHVREVVRANGLVRPIVHMPSILAAITKRVKSVPQKEQ